VHAVQQPAREQRPHRFARMPGVVLRVALVLVPRDRRDDAAACDGRRA
jgi:hypothetical protein